MKPMTMICVDCESLQNPALLGMAEEPLSGQDWLVSASSAQDCREMAASLSPDVAVWVVSCDDMEPINLAAALKRDMPERRVSLVSFSPDGSMASRAVRAGIDAVLDEAAFQREYLLSKQQAKVGPSRSDGNAHDQAKPTRETIAFDGVDGCARHAARAPKHVGLAELEPSESLIGEHQTPTSSLAGQLSEQAAVSRFVPQTALAARGVVVAVMSASGGCGKSAFTAVAAIRAAKRGVRTVVVDADLQFGDMDHLLGAQDPLRIDDAVVHRATLDVLCAQEFEGIPALLAAPSKVEDAESLSHDLSGVIRRLQESFDLVLVNTGTFWLEAHAVILECADTVFFMMDQRPSSLRATAKAVDLCARMGIATSSFVFVINRYSRTGMISSVDASCALRGADVRKLADGGTEIEELLGAGYAAELSGLRNPFCASVEELVMPLVSGSVRDEAPAEEQVAAKRRFGLKRGRRRHESA